jgi:putative transposase
LLELSLRTIERWETGSLNDKRKETSHMPPNKLTQEECEMIVMISNSKKYCDLPPCKIVPMLADEGQYIASESSFYRVLREKNQLAHRGHSKPAKHHKPKHFMAFGANQVWSWDISFLPTQVRGLYFYLYFIMDIYSRKIVGWSIHENELSEHAACLVEQACHDEKVLRDQLVLHSDNGSPMKGITMIAMLEKLGVLPSFSRPSVSDDNPYSEALFRTAKYHPTFPSATYFATITDARIWCEKFVIWYNQQHLHSALKFITPQQRHDGHDQLIMKNRHQVYEVAKQKNPSRWARHTRNWVLPQSVSLNPNKKKDYSLDDKKPRNLAGAA